MGVLGACSCPPNSGQHSGDASAACPEKTGLSVGPHYPALYIYLLLLFTDFNFTNSSLMRAYLISRGDQERCYGCQT